MILLLEIEKQVHDLLVKISKSEGRTVEEELNLLIYERASELGLIKVYYKKEENKNGK
jgi:hypothetical protein